jgi:hypothetical protein
MKRLRQLCVACVFTLLLTTTAFAGDIHTPGITQPQTPPNAMSATAAEDIATEGVSDSVADIALDLLQTMLSMF